MTHDYQKLGVKAGLEIHQQLDTKKLFCHCPSFLRSDEPDFEVKRKLHQVAGETGEVDAAVVYEASLGKEITYQGYSDTTCLVELDESPPNEINKEALREALKIACLMNCDIYQCAQIMRKTVIDGSNTSGFQRTVLIAHDGFIETSFGKVPIDSIALEEEAARIVVKEKDKAIYRLDRLGIPLIEITTAPTMTKPGQVKEAALKIGEILRACKVKRGIGTIRQDVNVSVRGHDKVEIKGFQDIKAIEKTIDFEISRQLEEIKKGKTIGEVRNAQPDFKTEFLRPLPGKARMYPETDLPLLKISRDFINDVKKVLPKLRTEIRDELKKKGLTEELINLIVESAENVEEFGVLMKVYDKDANLVAKMITLWRNELANKLKIEIEKINEFLSEKVFERILEDVKKNKIEKNDVRKVMEKIALGENLEEALKVEKISHDHLDGEIHSLVKEKPELSPNAYMGLLMQKHKGKIDAKRAMEIIQKSIQKT